MPSCLYFILHPSYFILPMSRPLAAGGSDLLNFFERSIIIRAASSATLEEPERCTDISGERRPDLFFARTQLKQSLPAFFSSSHRSSPSRPAPPNGKSARRFSTTSSYVAVASL